MKRFIILLVSLLLLFSLFACQPPKDNDNDDDPIVLTNQQKYELAKTMMDTGMAAYETEALSAENSYALQMLLNASASVTLGLNTIGTSADGKLQVLFDFDNIANSKLIAEANATYPGEGLIPNSQSIGIYYKDGYIYHNGGGEKGKNPVDLTQAPFVSGENYLGQLFAMAGSMLGDMMGGSELPDPSMLEGMDMDTALMMLQVLASDNVMNSLMLGEFISALQGYSFEPYDLFTFTVSETQVKASLNYTYIKEMILDVLDSIAAGAAAYDEDSLIENFGYIINATAFNDMIQNFTSEQLKAAYEAIFDDTQDPDYLDFINTVSYGYFGMIGYTYIPTFEEFSNDYGYYKDEISDWMTANVGIEQFNSACGCSEHYDLNVGIQIARVLDDLSDVSAIAEMIKACVPNVFTLEFTVNFSGAKISGMIVELDIAMKLPAMIFEKEAEGFVDVAASFDFSLAIETDASKITFIYPADLAEYLLEENN